MSSKTRIIVLHMKEVVYTIAFLILAVLLGILIYFMFGPRKRPDHFCCWRGGFIRLAFTAVPLL